MTKNKIDFILRNLTTLMDILRAKQRQEVHRLIKQEKENLALDEAILSLTEKEKEKEKDDTDNRPIESEFSDSTEDKDLSLFISEFDDNSKSLDMIALATQELTEIVDPLVPITKLAKVHVLITD